MSNYELLGILVALLGILVTIVGQALYIAFKMGVFGNKLQEIEKKQDKHNNLIERMVRVEDKASSAHRRLNDGEAHFQTITRDISEIKTILMRAKP